MVIQMLQKQLLQMAKEEYEEDYNFIRIRVRMYSTAYSYAIENDLTLCYTDVYNTVNHAMSLFIREKTK